MIAYLRGSGFPRMTELLEIPKTHLYDNPDPVRCTRDLRRALSIGGDNRITDLVITSAVGSTLPGLAPGTIVNVTDHLNLTRASPFAGKDHQPVVGTYERIDWLLGVTLAYVAGPQYETPAEVNMMRILGASVVGMDGPLEAMTAHAKGAKVWMVSLVTDSAYDAVTHDDVLAVAADNEVKVSMALERLCAEIRSMR